MDRHYYIDEWKIDLVNRQLSRYGKSCSLEPKAVEVLKLLIASNGEVISRQELQQDVWQGAVVSDAAINRVIAQLRKAFSDTANNSKYIVTIPKVGYRLAVSATSTPSANTTWKSKTRKSVIFLVILLASLVASYWFFPVGALKSSLKSKQAALAEIETAKHTKNNGSTNGQPLTELVGTEREPSLSRNERYLAFTHSTQSFSKSSVYIKDLKTKKYLRLTNGQYSDRSPFWSKDNKSVLFLRNTILDCEIREHFVNWNNFTIGKERIIFKCQKGQMLFGVHWDTQKTKLIFSLKANKNSPSDIYSYDPKTEFLQLELGAPKLSRGFLEGALSPDGKKLAVFLDGWQKYQIEIYSWPEKELVKKIDTVSAAVHFNWRKDSKVIIFAHGDGISGINIENAQTASLLHSREALYSIEFLENKNLLTSKETHSTDIGYFNLSKSQFGETGSIAIDPNYLMYPKFSPSGRELAYMNFDEEKPSLMIKNMDSNKVKGVELERYLFMLGWSPDGTEVLGTSQSRAWSMSIATGETQALSPEGWKIISPVWSNDGKSIYFGSKHSGDWQIWRTSSAESEPVQITFSGGLTVKAEPNGRYLYFNRQSEVGLWQMDLVTKKSIKLFDYDKESFWADYFIFDNGIYFVDYENKQRKLKFYNFASESIHTVLDIPAHWGSQISIDAQQKFLAFENFAAIESNIVEVSIDGSQHPKNQNNSPAK